MNKKILLLIVLVIGIAALLFSIIAFPFIASVFDGSPMLVSVFVGIFSLIFVFVFTFIIFKDKARRYIVLIPCFVFSLTSIIINSVRFGESVYRYGYIVNDGLYDSFGFSVIHTRYDDYYVGYNEKGDLVFLSLDFDTEEEDWGCYVIVQMDIYNSEGVFLGTTDDMHIECDRYEYGKAETDFKADLRKNGYERINARL